MKKKVLTLIEYKRRSEGWLNYRERGEETAREQYETVREALQIAGEVNGWTVRQVNVIMGTRSIEVSSWDKLACRSWEYPRKSRTGSGANTGEGC
jgi:hypothetical protein